MSSVKRKRSNSDSRKKESPLVREDSTVPPEKSILQQNEVSFPRGGASALTPLELKEVSNEAVTDVLFAKDSDSNPAHVNEPAKKRKKTTKSNKTSGKEKVENVVPIETLSFKTLIPGCTVLGEVIEINRLDIALALPDNLIGYIPITNISSLVTKQLEKLDNDDDESEGEESDSEDENVTVGTVKRSATKELPELVKLFKIGQWLRAVIVEPENKKNNKKRIELCIEPKIANKDLDEDDLDTGIALQVAVKSIEDHGIILDTGRPGCTAFISDKDVKAADYDPAQILLGSVFLSTVIKKKGRTLHVKFESAKKILVTAIASIDSIVPGNLIDTLVVGIDKNGLITKSYGLVDSTINLTHLNTFTENEIKHKFAIGSNLKARVIACIQRGGSKKLLLSLLPHVINLFQKNSSKSLSDQLEAFPIGHILNSVEVKGFGNSFIYVKIDDDKLGQVHFSNTGEDKKIDTPSFFPIGTSLKARVLGFSCVDGYYNLSVDPKVIKQKYLRPQDIPVGEVVTGEVVSVSGEKGITVKIYDQFIANVPPDQISDVKLIYPERKFKIGGKVKGRILKIKNRQPIVTLKKSLVGTETIITKVEDAIIGERTSATVVAFLPAGALVTFFGDVKAFLPKSEISQTFVKNPRDYLKLGQTLTVRVIHVNVESKKITVSCKITGDSTAEQKEALQELINSKSILKTQIVEKTKDSVVVETGDGLKGVIFVGHLSDGNYEQNRVILKGLNVGSSIDGIVIDKDDKNKIFNLSCKKSLIDASKEGRFPSKYSEIKVSDEIIKGYVKSVTQKGVFVGFGGKLVGLVLAKYASAKPVDDLTSVFRVNQSVAVRVIRTDDENERFLCSIRGNIGDAAINPVDVSIKALSDYAPGKVTKARVNAVKGTQLNVQLADNLQGRVDISQVYESFGDIKDTKHPLSIYRKGEIIDVKVIGYHDARNHTFLPITHRKSKQIIIELSAKKSDLGVGKLGPLTLDKLSVGSEIVGYINNIGSGFFWLTISPSIKAILPYLNLSSNAAAVENFQEDYPIGAALKVKIKTIDLEHNSVVVTSRDNEILSYEDVKVGEKLPAKVIKVADSYVIVELGESVSALANITDALDDYSDSLTEVFKHNEIIPAEIVDIEDEKIYVSLQSKNAKDHPILSTESLKKGDFVKGFIKNITNQGVFVSLGRNTDGYVKITDLSDSYIKDFKKIFKMHQLVNARVLDVKDGRCLLTLKESVVSGESSMLKTFEDLKVNDIFEGIVRGVTDFGVFVGLDGTANISGLCHQSQISDNKISDIKALFGEGDRVKVKILKINEEKKQLSLGMKASYFEDEGDDVEMEGGIEDEEIDGGENANNQDDSAYSEDDDNDELMQGDFDDEDNVLSQDESEENQEKPKIPLTGLSTQGFDWTASILDQVSDDDSSDEENFTETRTKKKRSRAQNIVEDTTGDINSKAPESVADFERLVIGNPNLSIVWMNYMSFQLQLSEIEKAREIGERALKTINYREEEERLNIWIALLNLENTFGTEETLEEVFKRSTEYMDSLTMHQKLASIYVISEKYKKANDLFKVMIKKFGKSSVAIWVSYGSYLLDRNEQERAHEVLGKALQTLPKRDHIEVVRKFAQLEFSKGDPEQGRTLFEGLVADVPKRIDLWNVYIDQEIKNEGKKRVEELFERVLTKSISRKQAKFFFSKWLSFEEKNQDEMAIDYVKSKAQEYVQKDKE